MTEERRKPTPEEKAKAAAEARAKAEALRKLKEQEAAEAPTATAEQPTTVAAKPVAAMTDEEKAKAKAAAAAAAAAKAKAAREAAAQAAGEMAEAGGDDADAKAKAAAAAKAKAAAAAAAAAKAKLAREAAQAGGEAEEAAEAPKAPSKNQPYLDKYVSRITEKFGADVLEASYINELSKEVPTLVVKNEKWHDVAQFLKEDEQLGFDYLSNLHGVDYEDRMEVYYHLYSYKNRQSVAVKVKTDREQPTVSSVMDIWRGADWNERETFDLFGIHFPGHINLTRILLPDEWVGYPLRKDYVQYDEEV